MTKVFVSGANGFIGTQVTKNLIEKGYDVVGSVRTAAKGDKLKAHLGAKFSYEIVLALTNEDAFDEAMKKHPDVIAFLHTASPVFVETNDVENDVVKPAVSGTLSALHAAHKYGPNVKKFVYTSSLVACASSRETKEVTEELWSDVTYEEAITVPRFAYTGSKKFAELAAWDFMEKEKPKFTLTTVNPVYVFGPVAFAEGPESFTSTLGIILKILQTKEGEPLPEENSSGPGVDVRDVANLHIAAFENDELAGKRLLANNEYWDSQLVIDTARKYSPKFAQTIPVGTPGSTTEASKKARKINNSETTRITGISWTPIETSFKDAIAQIEAILKASN